MDEESWVYVDPFMGWGEISLIEMNAFEDQCGVVNAGRQANLRRREKAPFGIVAENTQRARSMWY
jgi:hypothetical protein